MADQSRLDDLRRRVEKDPSSIAFAQLAEEYRRAGQAEQAVQVCNAGLRIHPGYLSARVTLGRALIELNQLDEAQQELERVLQAAPENLAAIRGLAEIHQRRGDLGEALAHFQAALSLARNDPDLERTVEELERKVAPQRRVAPEDGLSFEQIHQELLAHAPAFAPPASAPAASQGAAARPASAPQDREGASARQAPASKPAGATARQATTRDDDLASFFDELQTIQAEVAPAGEPIAPAAPVPPIGSEPSASPVPHSAALAATPVPQAAPVVLPASAAPSAPAAPSAYNDAASTAHEHAERTITALTGWLDALHVSRTERRP